MTSVHAQKAVEATLELLKKRIPAYGELADRFGPLFLEKARLRDALVDEKLGLPVIDPARLSAGVPLLAGYDCSLWTAEFVGILDTLLPILAESLQLSDSSLDSLKRYLADPDNTLGLVQARIEGDWKCFENTSVQLEGIPDTVLLYISENICTPVFAAMAEILSKSLSEYTWEHGNCPVCGSTPSISHLSPVELTDIDHLVGGGGKKYLHCSLCGHDWRFKRNTCPACGNDDDETREIFFLDDVKYERIEACHKCGTYCLNIDLRECQPHPHLDVVQIGLIHLDIYAHNNNLRPVTPTLWNVVDS